MVKLFHKRIIKDLAEADADLLSGLKKAGFNAWSGPEGSGFIMSEWTRSLRPSARRRRGTWADAHV